MDLLEASLLAKLTKFGTDSNEVECSPLVPISVSAGTAHGRSSQ